LVTEFFFKEPAIGIEILGATQEEACLKKGEIFFELISTLFCEVKRGCVDR
jgi:hypothetical protein